MKKRVGAHATTGKLKPELQHTTLNGRPVIVGYFDMEGNVVHPEDHAVRTAKIVFQDPPYESIFANVEREENEKAETGEGDTEHS